MSKVPSNGYMYMYMDQPIFPVKIVRTVVFAHTYYHSCARLSSPAFLHTFANYTSSTVVSFSDLSNNCVSAKFGHLKQFMPSSCASNSTSHSNQAQGINGPSAGTTSTHPQTLARYSHTPTRYNTHCIHAFLTKHMCPASFTLV